MQGCFSAPQPVADWLLAVSVWWPSVPMCISLPAKAQSSKQGNVHGIALAQLAKSKNSACVFSYSSSFWMLGRCPPRWMRGHAAPRTESLLSAETPNTLPPAELQEKSYLPSSAQGCRLGLAGKEEHAHLGEGLSTHWAHGGVEFGRWALTSLKYTLTKQIFFLFFFPCN